MEWRNPRVDGTLNGVAQGSERGVDELHLVDVLFICVVHVIEDHIAWRTGKAIAVKGLEIVKNVGATDK